MTDRRTYRLNDHWVAQLKPPKDGQESYHDRDRKGLLLLVGAAGTKTLRSRYKLHGRWVTRSLGHFNEIRADNVCAWARAQVDEDRRKAANGEDPGAQASTDTFGALVTDFIENHAKRRQRSWKETQRVLTRNCAIWWDRPANSITKRDALKLIEGFANAGTQGKAQTTLRWLRTLWSFAAKRDLVTDRHVMADVDFAFEKLQRTETFSDAELVAIWKAASDPQHITQVEGTAIKLLLLLAPRRSALENMKWEDLDDPENPTLWTTPFENTKTRKLGERRVYKTPLPPLAARLLKMLPGERTGYVFPSKIQGQRGNASTLTLGSPLKRKLVRAGAPASWHPHKARHTLASHFPEASDFEVGLLLNHSSGKGRVSVTQGYRHGGGALGLKRQMLEEWAAHIEKLLGGDADTSNVTRLG